MSHPIRAGTPPTHEPESALNNAATQLLRNGVSELEMQRRRIAAAIDKAASRGHPGVCLEFALPPLEPAACMVFSSHAVEPRDGGEERVAAYAHRAFVLLLRHFVRASYGYDCHCQPLAAQGSPQATRMRLSVHFLPEAERFAGLDKLYFVPPEGVRTPGPFDGL